ncbi:protein of unknown function DUF190 (plasmid) [Deinococcus geothermalis DSM 11300]|uniref:Uncharacterized protein n=1 Tax=Deinococcus geothermalis (strain DSM 11300 / CIP 105573 / AG-3a) TaxID=319795 RepID=Q1J3F6_DEIGD|nr:DUF190 domain-containing protein [Deinococcus geothermalis]ABF43978.1 protein of unknown function DUF190 [Deinococcus geothermalis DSM 11300]
MTAEAPLHGEVCVLRFYTLAGDTWRGHPLADSVVEAAHRAGLAGATLLRGMVGFGRHGVDTFLSVLEVHADHQPVMVELVDRESRLLAFLADLLAEGLPDRLVTLGEAEALASPPEK